MDPGNGRFTSSADGNGIQFGNPSMTVLPDRKTLDNSHRFGNAFSINDSVRDVKDCQSSAFVHNFRGIQFHPPNTSTVPIASTSSEDELHEDCDLSDAILGYITQVLMEEDMDDKSCMLHESLDLQAAEKSFYDVLGKKYPPSPSCGEGSFSVDQYTDIPHNHSSINHNTYIDNFSNGSGYLHHESAVLAFEAHNQSCKSVTSSTSGNDTIDGFWDSAANSFQASQNQMTQQFNKGVEEASKFLPSETFLPDWRILPLGSRVRKSPYGEDENEVGNQERSIKQAAIYPDSTLRSKEIDLILLSTTGQGREALKSLRDTLRKGTNKEALKDVELKSKGEGKRKVKGRKQNMKKEVIDLRTLLLTCAQAVASDDRRSANELLKQIRQHSTPFGDGNQRLAHCFANGLEARLAGTGSQIHKALVSKKASSADYIKAYHLYMASCPFRKISNFASNRTIMERAEKATRIHIIDFGILYGFQWPTFIQRISTRTGGPPRLRITGIEFPQPGFRPSQRIEETGLRLKDYATQFKVPFEYNPIAKTWENVSIVDLNIDEGELLVVNCMYRSKNLLDETVVADSARNVVLNLIKKISPDIFIHGIVNGSYNAPFFVTRFREALFHFSALFDMLETNVPRERSERLLLEREFFGREALNVISCEGWERVERPETYKQWHVRNLRAGLVPVPFSGDIFKIAGHKVGLYHKDFMIDVDNQWLLQGWKGRIIYAISCWKAA